MSTTAFTLNRDGVAACACFMAHKDARYYLCGLLVEIKGGNLFTVATDGHALGMYWHGDSSLPDAQYIVPADVVKAAIKGKGSNEEMQVAIEGQTVTFGNTIGTLVDGKYPEWQGVIPTKLSGKFSPMNPEITHKVVKAGKALGCPPNSVFSYGNDTRAQPFWFTGEPSFLAVVMGTKEASLNFEFTALLKATGAKRFKLIEPQTTDAEGESA